MKKTLVTLLSCLVLSCTSVTPANQSALIASSRTLASEVLDATGHNSTAASLGLDGLATVMQAYVGQSVPTSVLVKSPGIAAVGTIASTYISTKAKVNQADVNAIWTAVSNIAADKFSK